MDTARDSASDSAQEIAHELSHRSKPPYCKFPKIMMIIIHELYADNWYIIVFGNLHYYSVRYYLKNSTRCQEWG